MVDRSPSNSSSSGSYSSPVSSGRNSPVIIPVGMDQDAINAAIAAALAHLTANPIAGINISSATSTLHVLQTMRKYDGSYSAADWLGDFDQERSANNLNVTWAVRNIDRVLEGTAATWWKSQRGSYITRINDPAGVPATIYQDLSNSMKVFFSVDSIRERARIENEHVRFNFNDDPVGYVARKVDVLTRMNSTMPEREQVMHLLLGLPDQIRMLVSPGDVSTVDKFCSKLSMQLSLHKRALSQNSEDRRNSSQNSGQRSQVFQRKVGFSRDKTSQKKFYGNRPIEGLEIPEFSDDHKASCVDEQGNRVCFYCKKRGHTVRACFKLAREQNLPIPSFGKKQGQSGSEN